MLNKILVYLGLRRNVGAPVHAGINPTYFTYVYCTGDSWLFAWHTANHRLGEVSNPFYSQEGAETARQCWEEKKKYTEHANFVRP